MSFEFVGIWALKLRLVQLRVMVLQALSKMMFRLCFDHEIEARRRLPPFPQRYAAFVEESAVASVLEADRELRENIV